MEISVADVPGQYLLRTRKAVKVYNVAKQQIGTMEAGTLTPLVDSYIGKGTAESPIYWQFLANIPGTSLNSWYLRHEKDAFDLVPYFSNPTAHKPENLPFSFLPSFDNLPSAGQLKAVGAGLLITAAAVVALILWKK
jgi:hypothetical protein